MADVNSVVITSAPNTAPEGHEEKMVALVDGSANPEGDLLAGGNGGDTEDRPSWLPEKFTSAEDLAKAYAELEAKQSGKPQDAPQANQQANTEADPQKALSDKGLDFTEFSNEFSRTGELSTETYAKLAQAGFDKGIVDNYIAGQQAIANQYTASVQSEVGGAEKYAEIMAWAKGSLTPAEINAYNAAVDSGSVDHAKLALSGLNAKFSQATGNEPRLVTGRTGSSSEDVFESTAQLTAAMKDPKYRNDPAYRAKVQAKLSRSNLF